MSRVQDVTSTYESEFGAAPAVVCHGPGRVNLIGDHTDYNDGFVLPAAINYGTDIAASLREDRIVRAIAVDYDNQLIEFDLDNIEFNKDSMWVNYIAGTLIALMEKHPDIKGVDMTVAGNVPQGAGLSSSASFEIAILKTVSQLNNIVLSGSEAALMGQAAENNFVGCNCGIMDQMISAVGEKGNAMLLDCRDLTYKPASIPDGMSLVIINSNVKRGLVDSEYNTRREQCEAVAKHFGQPALRDVSIDQLESAKAELSDELYRRAKHVITESTRTESALAALNAGDMATLSGLMRQSHLSLKGDFEVTTKEMDFIVELVNDVLGSTGGVRMTGGGFGGCVVALTPNEKVDAVKQTIAESYEQETGLRADIYVCVAEDGAFKA